MATRRRYLAARGVPPQALLRFALGTEDERRSVLGIDEPALERELLGAS